MGKETDEKPRDLREGMLRVSVVPQKLPQAGGEPFIAVDEGPEIVSPGPHTQSPGQTTHE